MGDRMNNMNKMMQNPKSRNMYLTVIALAVLTLGTGFWFATRTAKNNKAPAGAVVANVPQVQSSPGTSRNPEYNEKVREFNQQQGSAALATPDKTSIPTLTSSAGFSDKSPLDLLEKEAAAKRAAEAVVPEPLEPEIIPVPVPPPVIITAPVVAVAPPPPMPAPKKYGSMEDYMLLSTLSGSWKIKAPSSEFDYARTKDTTAKEEFALNQGNTGTGSNTQVNPLPLAKAGSIFNAILETGINSDEPSPVLAKIISGELKGGRLIGQINRVGEKVLVQFSTVSLPNSSTSIKLNAVAIDINTSRTALASDVNNHYFQKYGIMFAAAFLGGYANAIGRQNTTTIIDPSGGATVVQGNLDTKDINRQAIGNVGKELAEATRMETQNLKPTITVDQGIAIGILLMDDLIVR